jgi:hypothetical protein
MFNNVFYVRCSAPEMRLLVKDLDCAPSDALVMILIFSAVKAPFMSAEHLLSE